MNLFSISQNQIIPELKKIKIIGRLNKKDLGYHPNLRNGIVKNGIKKITPGSNLYDKRIVFRAIIPIKMNGNKNISGPVNIFFNVFNIKDQVKRSKSRKPWSCVCSKCLNRFSIIGK